MQKSRWRIAVCALAFGLVACGPGDDEPTDAGNQKDDVQTVDATDTGVDDDEETGTSEDAEDQTDDGGEVVDEDSTGETTDGSSCDPGDVYKFAGEATIHPASQQIDESPSIGGSQLSIIRALPATNGDIVALEDKLCQPAVMSIDSSGTSGSWSFEGDNALQTAEINSNDLDAAVAIVGNQGDSGDFINTATGLAASPIESDVTGRTIFSLTTNTEAKLANLLESELSNVDGPGDLVGGGFVLMQFMDGTGDGASPVEGVTVTKGGHGLGNGDDHRLAEAYYPGADFQSLESGKSGATASHGMAILPSANVLNKYGGAKSTTDGKMKFPLQRASGQAGGIAFVVVKTPMQQ